MQTGKGGKGERGGKWDKDDEDEEEHEHEDEDEDCLLYTSPSPRDLSTSRMPSSA